MTAELLDMPELEQTWMWTELKIEVLPSKSLGHGYE